MLPMAHASDGFGSIRAPAACCGVVGLKPTRSRNTFAPFLGEGLGGCSTEHAVTLTVRDCAALLDATCGPGPGDPYVAPSPAGPYLKEVGAQPRKLNIAWTAAAPNGAKVDSDCLRALAETVELCADLGHRVEECDPQIDRAAVVPTFLTIISVNTIVNLASHPAAGRTAREGDVERVTWLTAKRGEKVPSADYVRATQTAHRLGRQMAAFHSRWDVLLRRRAHGSAASPCSERALHDGFRTPLRRLCRYSVFPSVTPVLVEEGCPERTERWVGAESERMVGGTGSYRKALPRPNRPLPALSDHFIGQRQ